MTLKKAIGWTALGLLALVVVAVTAFCFVQRSQGFHRWVIKKAEAEVQQRLGTQLQIQSYDIHWSSLTVDIFGVVLRGSGPTTQKPLFAANRIAVQLKVVSLLKHKFALNELIVDHPVVNILVNAAGNSNLPHVSATPSKPSSFNLFSIAIERLTIGSGNFFYNNREIPLDAQVQHFHASAVYAAPKSEYDGSLSYADGFVQFKNYGLLPNSFRTRFRASASHLELNQAMLDSGHSHVELNAMLTNYASPRITGNYQAVIDTADFRQPLQEPRLPSGQIATTGFVEYASGAGSFLQKTRFDAQLSSPKLALATEHNTADIQNVNGHISLQHGDLEVQRLSARVFGGALSVDGQMKDLAGTPVSQFRASLEGMSVPAIANSTPLEPVRRFTLTGTLSAQANAAWRGPISSIRAQAQANVHGTITPRASTALPQPNQQGAPLPVNAALNLDYNGARGAISFSNSSVRMPQTTIALNGTLTGIARGQARPGSNLTVQLQTNDLSELGRIAAVAESTAATPSVTSVSATDQLASLHGSLSLNAQIHGSINSPDVDARLLASNLQVRGTQWRMVRTNVSLNSSNLVLQNGIIQTPGAGQMMFNARAALTQWKFEKTNPITIETTANHISAAEVEQLTGRQYPVSGDLDLQLSVHGSVENPAGHGTLQLTKAKIEQEQVQGLLVQFQGTGKNVQAQLGLKISAGAIAAKVNYAVDTESYNVQLGTTGIKLQNLQIVQNRNLGLAGTLIASFNGSGSVAQPQLAGTLSIQQFQVGSQSIPQFQAQLGLTNRTARLAIDAHVADASLNAKGTVDLTGNYPADVTIDTQPFPIGALLARFEQGAATGLEGQTEIHATVKGPLKDPQDIQASVDIPRFSLSYQAIQLAASGPIRMDYRNGAITISPAELKGPETDIHIQGFVPIKTSQPMNVSAAGTVNLAVLHLFDSNLDSSGSLDVNVSARGQVSRPETAGQIHIVKAAIAATSLPVNISNLNGTLQLSGERVNISELQGTVGGGKLTAQGFASLQPLAFNIGINADSMRILYPQGVRSVVSAKLALTGDQAASTASGSISLDRLSFTRGFDLASLVGQFSGPSVATASSTFEQNIKLNIAVQSANQLSAESGNLTIQGAANLRITGTAANPIVLGRANLTGGEVNFLGNTYKIQSGVIDFANPVRINPTVNLYVSTTVDEYDITLNFIGPIDQMRTTYLSNPSLPPVDIIHLLAFGQTTEQAATSPTEPATVGAESFLATAASSKVTSALQTFTGISQISISPGIGANTPNTGTTITIRERISGKLTFSASTDVTQTQQEILSLQYQLKPKIGVSVTRDQNGGFAIQAQIHSTF